MRNTPAGLDTRAGGALVKGANPHLNSGMDKMGHFWPSQSARPKLFCPRNGPNTRYWHFQGKTVLLKGLCHEKDI